MPMVTQNAGWAIMSTLRSYGVDAVFGIPGTHSVEFYRHFGSLGIHAVTPRHEQGAGYGADGWSQLKSLPGVVITTSGPGLLNVMSAAATAYAESRPMIILSPGTPTGGERLEVGALHETKDPSGAMDAIVFSSTRVSSGREAVELIHDAFEMFSHCRPRPVHIEVPLDVLEGHTDVTVQECQARDQGPARGAAKTAIAAAAHALRNAAAPVILAGGGAVPASKDVLTLCELLQAPVVTSLNGKAVIPEGHQLSLGSNLRLRAAREVCNQADVLLIIGSKVGEAELWETPLDAPSLCIRIDIAANQMTTNVVAEIELVGNSTAVLPQLLEALEGHIASAPLNPSTAKAAILAEARALAPELAELNEIVSAVVPEGTVICGDSSQVSYLGTGTFMPQADPHRFLYMPTYATLGYGLPAAIGAKIAAPDLPVLCLLGDGALMFSIQELITAVEQQVDITIVCVDNGGYREIRQNMLDREITPVGVDLAQPDWVALAQAFGLAAYKATGVQELSLALTDALAVKGPSLVHLHLN